MRASCEWALKNESDTIPFIRLRIYKTDDDITLKISDRGGGMSRRTKKKIFNYMYSTATDKVSYEGIGGGSYGGGISASTLPMHGLGYGLPLSRLYARYFRGDIKVFFLNPPIYCVGYGLPLSLLYARYFRGDIKVFF